MKIDRQGLVDILTIIKPALAKREIVEQTIHFIFTGSDILTYNDYLCIVHPYETEFTCSVPAEEFYKVLTTLSDDELDLTFKDGKIRLKGKRTSSGLSTGTGENVLGMVDALKIGAAEKKMKPLPKDFLDGIGLCMFSVSKDMSHPVLTGILVDGDAISSTDDLRVSQYVLDKDMGARFNLPGAAAEELTRFPAIKFYASKTWAYFLGEKGVILCARLISADGFPEVDNLFKFKGVKLDLPEEFKSSVETALIMAQGEIEKDRLIDVTIEDKTIQVRGEKEIGWLQKDLDLPTEVKSRIVFSINPHFLIRILNHTRKMKYSEEGDRALFTSENFYHLLALKGEDE